MDTGGKGYFSFLHPIHKVGPCPGKTDELPAGQPLIAPMNGIAEETFAGVLEQGGKKDVGRQFFKLRLS